MYRSYKKLIAAAMMVIFTAAFSSSISGHSGFMKLVSPETYGNGYFALNLSTLLGSAAESDTLIVKSSKLDDYFQSTNHMSLVFSLGNYIDISAKASFAIDSRDSNNVNHTLTKLNNLEFGLRTSFKRTGTFRAGMYLYGQVPVIKDPDDLEYFARYTEVPGDTIRYYNHRKFSDEFLYNPMASFGGKIMTSFGNDYFRFLLNGGYLWRTATEKHDSLSLDVDILPNAWTMGAGVEIYLNKKASIFFEWDGELLVDKEDVAVTDEEFPQRAGAGFKFVGNDNFSATIGGFAGLNEDAPTWQAYLGLTFCGNWIDPDTDKDGIIDELDKCPTQPEDFDGFEDGDGCPEADNDGDGIDDHLDNCPLVPEDLDGFEDEDGCPDPDNDGDGIEDSVDKCPNEPEDFDGFEDQDGCPESDNDGDGLPDNLDKCPNEPEDFDAWDDADGCPEFDNDGDGIQDSMDKCPNDAETFNGFEDEDGCPDAVILKKDERIILNNIYFKLGSAELEFESFETLNSVKRIFLDNPGIVIQIEGHTDSQGSDEYNLKLSQLRAESVSNYLTDSLGISRSQLTSVGFGESKPIASNKTSKGRAQNRRIEFRVISTR